MIALILLFSLNAQAEWLVVDQGNGPAVIFAKGFTPHGLIVGNSPVDGTGNVVKTIADITIQQNNLTVCSGPVNCANLLVGLCTPTDGVGVINGANTRVFCAKPVFDSAKRSARLIAEANEAALEQARKDDLANNEVLLRSAYAAIDSINDLASLRNFLKLLVKHLLRE